MSNKPERQLNVLQAVAIIIALTIGSVVGAFWAADSYGGPNTVCRTIRTACPVTDSRAVFADKNGTVCNPQVNKGVGCQLQGYSLRYVYQGTEYGMWSSTRQSNVYREEEVCFEQQAY